MDRHNVPKALIMSLLLSACLEGTTGSTRAPVAPEAALAQQARAMQSSVIEGAAFGALVGGLGTALFGGDGDDVTKGILIGAATGAAAGGYVGHLQNGYASKEARLDRLHSDLGATNAETAATIRSMQAVLGQQRRDLTALRAGAPAPSGAPSVAAVRQRSAASLADMNLAIGGAERRYVDFRQVRALNPGPTAGVDGQIAELGHSIGAMRGIADTLARET